MSNNIIRIGGVPEHFNLPWHLAMEKRQFRSRGVTLEWTTFKGGTGEMTRAMRDGEVDVCVLLTEGIINDIIKGNPSKIISLYVRTPLKWGIHTGSKNVLRPYDNIFSKKFAISRLGSGSHLMPMIDAHGQGKTIKPEQFHVIGNLTGALKSLAKLETDAFYWEKFTTKPFVDSGVLRRIGEYVTPWPCFVIAATNKILKEQPENVIRMLRIIHDMCDLFMQNDSVIEEVSKRYNQKVKDVERWYHNTEWAIHGWVSDKMIKSVIYHLNVAGITTGDEEIPELIWKR